MTEPASTRSLTAADTVARCAAILDEIERAVVGKREALEQVMLAVLAGGHVLLEDLPGLGKTLVARSFAATLGLRFTRVQFTPDLLPADLTGSYLYDQSTGEFSFRPGPVFTQLLLADEINRTPPKTQAALLEAMQETQVTVEGTTRQLPRPFIVVATQNPIEYEGTYPLPEAQLDRFLLRGRLGYLDADREVELLERRRDRQVEEVQLSQVVDADELLAMRRSIEEVHASAAILRYVVEVVAATREHPHVLVGASPRGALAVMQLSRGYALLRGRDFVTPDDVKAVGVAALGHRLTLRPEMWVRRITGDDVVGGVLEQVPAPVADRR
jgi:MoxR-like ATPase